MSYNYIDKYKKRLGRQGTDNGQAYASNTIAFINANFHASPTFKKVEVASSILDIIEIDTRIVEVERMGNLRQVLFRPFESLPIGTYIKFDGEVWIVSDLCKSYEYQTTALIQKCNHKIRWSTSENWLDSYGNLDTTKIKEFDCIVSQSPLGSKASQGRFEIEWNRYDVNLAKGQLLIYVEKNEFTSSIGYNNRFIFGDNNVYEVSGIDDVSLIYDNYGIIQFTIKLSTKQEKDDFTNKIAFNKYGESVDEIITDNPTTDEDEGGRIW